MQIKINETGTKIEIHEVDKGKEFEKQFSGKIDNLDPVTEAKKKGRGFVTKTLLFTGCGILIVGFLAGTISNNWVPFERTSNLVNWIFGCAVGYYFK